MKRLFLLLGLLLLLFSPGKMYAMESQNVADNPVFRNVKVSGEKGHYKVSGEARPIKGLFYYSVEDGHNEFISETVRAHKTKFPKWAPFSISIDIDKSKLPVNASLILNLYERSKKDKSIIHSYPVLLEQFYPQES
ncbi:intracellular proteinase inhibitor [Bacillus methanolicus]|uniref:Gmad2 immunoglobulin-like domain-containing protein n=1 Tax=Bacillus methanolicus TaxID=1471 RepID=UPI00200CA7B9|nr:Gmad2 immunoglobulin-like domain-containing protein [Bacillus methanolicus]UQD51387.1 intracellular proteinase inhibitor [Bacillus methanolicus]